MSPSEGLNPEVAHRINQGQVRHVNRKFEPQDLDNADMVLTAIDDPEASTQIWKLCKQKKVPANIADVPPECDFYFGSIYRDGPLQIMVSTNGKGPKMASNVRKQIAQSLPANLGNAIQKVGLLRQKLRGVAPGNEEGPKRMQWYGILKQLCKCLLISCRMSSVCEKWSLEDFVEMSDEDMSSLLSFYPAGTVPALDSIRLKPDKDVFYEFDGSFGWW